jgi:hypothetical protein
LLASLAPAAILPSRNVWLRGPGFDLAWLVGLPAMGAALALIAFPLVAPVAWPIYALTTGQAHFAATYARVYFEPAELHRWWRAAIFLPFYILAAVMLIMGLGGEVGLAALFTLAFAWGYWHYARQAFGVACHYQRRVQADALDRRLLSVAIHVPAMAAALWFMSRLPGSILGLPVLRLPVPVEVAFAIVALAPLAVLPVLIRAALGHGAGMHGRVDIFSTLLSGGVFYTALVFTPDAAAAHLGVSLWHTVQYHAFVYHAQVQRFPDASRPGLLPWLLAEGKRWRYFVFLSLLAFCVFAFPAHLTRLFGAAEPVAVMIANTTWLVINFHHYLLDGWIWARPKQRPVAVPLAA